MLYLDFLWTVKFEHPAQHSSAYGIIIRSFPLKIEDLGKILKNLKNTVICSFLIRPTHVHVAHISFSFIS